MLKSKALAIVTGAGALLATALLVAAPAQALTLDFTSCHIVGGCGTSPFGTVTLTQVGANVTVDVALSDNNQFVQTGALDSQLFVFSGSGVALGDIVNITGTGAPVPLVADAGPFSGPDGTGTFQFGIECSTDCTGGSNPFHGPIDFTVNNATIADLLAVPSGNAFFLADVLIGNAPGTGLTGVIDVPVPAPVIGHGLLVLLAVGGVLFGSRLLERGKKPHATA